MKNVASGWLIIAALGCAAQLSACGGQTQNDVPVAQPNAPVNDGGATSPVASTPPVDPAVADAAAPPYEATLAQGMEFGKSGYPSFLESMAGISNPEGWGRWTDATLGSAKLKFKDPLPQRFKLELDAKDFFGTNADRQITVKVGDVAQQFTLDSAEDVQHVELAYSLKSPADTIEILVPNHSAATANDQRQMGIGLVSLKIVQ
jgi:phosphoglycerol transferase